jgi:NAD+ kinase
MDVGIVAKRDSERAASLARSLGERLAAGDVGRWFDATTAAALGRPDEGRPVSALDDCDLVVSVGGDGTFLLAAQGANGTPILGVNLGEVGFLNAVGPAEAEAVVWRAVEARRRGELPVRALPRLAAHTDDWAGDPAVNEVVVQGPRRGRGGGGHVEVRVDGSTYDTGAGDGVLVATPTGSSAYNLSERGPLVHPGVDALVVNAMAVHGGRPPLVHPADDDVTVSVTVSDVDRVVVASDGRDRHEVDAGTTVRVGLADRPVRLAGPVADYFEALEKLD